MRPCSTASCSSLRAGAVAPFNDLQQRLNRKTVTARMLRDYPAHVRLYDLLFDEGEDLRALPFTERAPRLEAWHETRRPAADRRQRARPLRGLRRAATRIWAGARAAGIEGLMLKRKSSPYLAGRRTGHWFKWKRAALTLDCVLMYAQRGSGKRSSYYSDYTFGVWREADRMARPPELVPVGKAYSGFTDEELGPLDRFIRDHTVEQFGPVRSVEPKLVLEVAFDAVFPSVAAQVRRRHALSAHPSHPLGQAGGGGRYARIRSGGSLPLPSQRLEMEREIGCGVRPLRRRETI